MASDFKLVIKEIRGESQDKRFGDGIDVVEWSIGAMSPNEVYAAQATSRVRMSDMTIIKNADLATPVLYQCCTTNILLKEVKLVCRKSGADATKVEYLVIELKNARIRGVNTKVQQSLGIAPVETVTIGYQKIKITYKEQSKEATGLGPSEFEHDLTEGA